MAGKSWLGRAAANVAARRGGYHLMLSALMSMVALSGCTASEKPVAAPSPHPSSSGSSCDKVRSTFHCASVRVGNRDYRYSIARPAKPAAQPSAVVVDLGGPGRSLFGNNDFAGFAKAWPGGETLVALEEPWVLADLSRSCKAALEGFYRAVHDGPSVSGQVNSQLASACDLTAEGRWGWSPANYRAVVDKILQTEGLTLSGVVGSSYGASRTAALWNEPSIKWAVLNSPSPLRLGGNEYLRARRDGALKALRTACANCSGSRDERKLVHAAAQLLGESPVRLTTRMPIVNATDAAAATVSLAYLPLDKRSEAVAALRSPAKQESARLIGSLSDSLMLRYGDHDMSPGMLAYFQEVCATYPGWDSQSSEPVEAFLGRLHAPCASVPARPTDLPASTPEKVCVAQAANDQVTPVAFGDQWLADIPRAISLKKPGDLHATPTLAADCYRTLTKP